MSRRCKREITVTKKFVSFNLVLQCLPPHLRKGGKFDALWNVVLPGKPMQTNSFFSTYPRDETSHLRNNRAVSIPSPLRTPPCFLAGDLWTIFLRPRISSAYNLLQSSEDKGDTTSLRIPRPSLALN